MGNGFLDRVEDNATVRTWAEMVQRKKGDSLAEGYVSELWDFTRVSVAQNNLQELKEIWDQWNNKDLILAHLDARKKVDVFALSIYGLIVFPKILGHVDKAVTDLFDRLDKRNLREEDIEWRAPWLLPDEILYRCGDFNWVPLLEIWGAVSYAPLLVLRQYRSRQFVPTTQGLAECEFSYKDDGYKRKARKMANAW
ncbi:hypothetical protein Gotur_027330, partial [Gossypium turneri]